MYRNEWEAAVARATALEQQLKQAQSATVQDQMQIASLTLQLQGARQELARLQQQGIPQQPYAAPYGAPYGAPMGYQAYAYADRSGTIMVLGILSLLVCHILGPIAWSMGNEELRRIDSGQSPPEGRGNASAGRICGIIASVLMIFAVVIIAFVFIAVIATAGHHHSSYNNGY